MPAVAILPTSARLTNAEAQLLNKLKQNGALTGSLHSSFEPHTLILLHRSPSLKPFTKNSPTAAERLIPCSVRVENGIAAAESILSGDPKSEPARAYRGLIGVTDEHA